LLATCLTVSLTHQETGKQQEGLLGRTVKDRDETGKKMERLKEVMTLREASQYLGISPDTLYKYLSQRQIPAFKLGNRWRFKKDLLDRWMEKKSERVPDHTNKRLVKSIKRG
jgi:excisionase family DNA binding protein